MIILTVKSGLASTYYLNVKISPARAYSEHEEDYNKALSQGRFLT